MDGLTIEELARDEFKGWWDSIKEPKKDNIQAQTLEALFVEAWIRGFAYRMANGEANNVRA